MKRVIEDSILNDIAKAIQEKNGTDTKYEDVEMAQAVRDISTSKEEQEKTINVTENGVTEILPDEGKTLSKVIINTGIFGDEHYDTFWDSYQQNGKRTDYRYAFSGKGWNDTTFKPKYDISISGKDGEYMFMLTLIKDLENIGITIDTSNATSLRSMFINGANITCFPLDLQKCTDINSIFGWNNTVEKVTLNNIPNTLAFNSAFISCFSLKKLFITGEIGKDISFSYCSHLELESAKNVLTHLVNYKGTGKEHSYSVIFHNNIWDLLDAEGETSPNGTTWKAYTDNKGWNY